MLDLGQLVRTRRRGSVVPAGEVVLVWLDDAEAGAVFKAPTLLEQLLARQDA